ncbi:MAG: allophanate hydrolase, partial [Acidobacteriota bacterium]
MAPAERIRETYRRIREQGERPVWIHVIPEEVSLARLEALGSPEQLPLHGMTFAIKDNIDLADVPTTAGCPDYGYVPVKSATVVERLMAAGAIPIGKTNLDQFAAGLVGTRSPYGACSSVFGARYISGGSSSGSAVAVAGGLVDFSLGTDTAGSGRVPASLNHIVGLKPTRGALSTAGVVPACRTLDCVSIFAANSATAGRIFTVARGFDADHAYSRAAGQKRAWPASGFRFGVPAGNMLRFFGDGSAAVLYREAVARFEQRGGTAVEFDYSVFLEAAQLLYAGPWVAERLAAIRQFDGEHPEALYPVTRQIILNAGSLPAVDAFEAMYRLAELARRAAREWERMDFMLLPTAGAAYTHEEIAAEPLALNTNLGYYTNFVNLLDLAALAIPAGMRANGIPFGVTLIGPAWSDEALLSMADQTAPYCPAGYVALAVCGAHLTGQPLNHQLTSAGAFLIEATQTSPNYRLYALSGTVPPKPGLEFTVEGGAPIDVEVWAVPESAFGRFVAAVPSPLAIGTCTLSGGRAVKSFVCEPWALHDATDITHLGGWRQY